jgi:hypothetical protein
LARHQHEGQRSHVGHLCRIQAAAQVAVFHSVIAVTRCRCVPREKRQERAQRKGCGSARGLGRIPADRKPCILRFRQCNGRWDFSIPLLRPLSERSSTASTAWRWRPQFMGRRSQDVPHDRDEVKIPRALPNRSTEAACLRPRNGQTPAHSDEVQIVEYRFRYRPGGQDLTCR